MKNIPRRVDKVPDIDEYTSTHLYRRKLPLKIRFLRWLSARFK